MKRITGTSVYSFAKCPRLAALDLHLDRKERRPPHPWEEFVARRGREFEADFVQGLDAHEPQYPERDFAAGAQATLELLQRGVPWIYQAVLRGEHRLGLPDLLRRVPGASALGDFHYEVVDVKSSGRARGDQILQVSFYSRLLAASQQRLPEHGALVLKDGREERFLLADYAAAAAEVDQQLEALLGDAGGARPFLAPACESCHWNHRCLPELQARQDLSLVQGMSHGARAILESLGVHTVAELATFEPEGMRARGNLDAVLVRKLRRGAQAMLLGKPMTEARPRQAPLEPAALVHLLADPWAGRVLAFGVLSPAREDGAFHWVRPLARADEWRSFLELLALVPRGAHLLHFGEALPHWYEEQAFSREAEVGTAARFVEIGRRLRSAASYPGPVFGLPELVRHGLARDPFRFGHAGAAAMWEGEAGADARLQAKLRGDLQDLAALKQRLLDVADLPAGSTATSSASTS